MAKTSGKSRSLLPAKHPKRTGKRGVGPKLDPKEDFETPTKKPDGETSQATESKGSSLLVEQPPKPKVVGDRMEVFYLKPVFTKTPKGDILVSLAITVPIDKEHEELLPEIIAAGYKDLLKKGRSTLGFKDLPGQRAEFYLSQDIKEETLVLPAAKMISANLSLVQRKGEGSARKVVRLSFRLQVKLSREVTNFAEHNLQNNFWLSLKETEEKLFDEEE